MNKLLSLNIEEISGVDRPANKRSFLIIKQAKTEDVNKAIRKEGDKYCLYDAEGKKLGTFDSEEDAKAAQMKMSKGATMKTLTKEQIAKIGDTEVQTAIIEQQEEMNALEKKVKELEETVTTLKANVGQAGKDDEAIWKGVPAALRSRFEALQKERDDAQQREKVEKDARETSAWTAKLEKINYLSISAPAFAKVMKNVAEHCPNEAGEIERVLFQADEIIGKGHLFAEIGKSANGRTPVGDAANVSDRVNQMADELMMLDKNLTKDQAISKVFSSNPGLHDQYRKAESVRV